MKVTPSVLIISKVLRAEATGSIITYVLFFFLGGGGEGGGGDFFKFFRIAVDC